MAEVELTKVSSRGQIVIPHEIRENMHIKEGDAFAAVASGDTLMLKRVKTPSKEDILREFEKLVERGTTKAKKLGIKERDIPGLIHKARGIGK